MEVTIGEDLIPPCPGLYQFKGETGNLEFSESGISIGM
jgi:hypothetical protein